jgi:hypothetical protein
MKKQVFLFALALLTLASWAQAQTRETRNVSTFTKIAFRVPGKLYLRQGSPQKIEIEGKKDVLEEIETNVEGSKLVIGQEDERKFWKWKEDDEVNVYITVKDLEGISVAGSGDVIGETKILAGNLDLNVSGSGNLKLEAEATGDIESDVSGSGDINLKAKCRSFNSDVSGSGKVILTITVSGTADFGVTGSGKIEATGTAGNVKTSISGSGKVLASNLETSKCEVRITGSGDVEINVKDELDASISGSGSVGYKGNPSRVNSHSSGSGHVHKL